MSTDVDQPRVMFPTTAIGAGEVLDLTDVDQVAAWSHELSRLWGAVMQAKRVVDDVLREQLAAAGQTVMIMPGGEYEVSEEPGKATYDGELLFTGLVEAGLDPDVVAQMFRPELRDARELGKLERRNDAVAKAAEAARSRGRGRVKVSRKRAQVGAPVASEEHHQLAQERSAEQRAARSRGI
jgi:hypothetical protein